MSQDPAVKKLLSSPLGIWFTSCISTINKEEITIDELVKGYLFRNVFYQMDLPFQDIDLSSNCDERTTRLRNLQTILANLRQFYEKKLGLVILKLPNISGLAEDPELHLSELQLLLHLLLGCAVQCPNNAYFVNGIQKLDESTQSEIAECIRKILHTPYIVLSAEMLRFDFEVDDEQLHLTRTQKAFEAMRLIYQERNEYDEELKRLKKLEDGKKTQVYDYGELLEYKYKANVQREELREVRIELDECKEEIKECKETMANLTQCNEKLVVETRMTKKLRDDLDVANEKAEKVDRLEEEIARYKKKLVKMESLEKEVERLQEDRRISLEKATKFSDSYAFYKVKAQKNLKLDKEVIELKNRIDVLMKESTENRQKYQSICEEKNRLEKLLKSNKSRKSEDNSKENSYTKQMGNRKESSNKLKEENRQIPSLFDSLKDKCVNESAAEIKFLKKENDKLKIQLSSNTQKNNEIKILLDKTSKQCKVLQDKVTGYVMMEIKRRNQSDCTSNLQDNGGSNNNNRSNNGNSVKEVRKYPMYDKSSRKLIIERY